MCRAETAGPGARGPLDEGLQYAAFCFGCCWALMAALFVLGVMSIAWMVVISVVISAQKLLPWSGPARVATALLLLGLAVGVAA